MYAQDYKDFIKFLMERFCLLPEDVLFVENIAAWSKEHGIPEPDERRPMKLVSKNGSGCRMMVRQEIPEEVINERVNALRIRGQLESVAFDRADLLNSDKKKLAYLFLHEYASSLPDVNGDELSADDWAFKEMERLGLLRT